MALLDLWESDRQQVSCKRIEQLIAFAGEGRLLDGNATSTEFRALLSVVPSDVIGQWLDECLENRFGDFGFVVYRSHANEGYDGLWRNPDGRTIIVEVKSSTAYSISLSRISDYRKQVAPQLKVRPEAISILIVVGSEDTSEFEAQVRGSRYAWDIRLLGVKSLFRLLKLREALDDETVEKQIQDILFPEEFTRLDRIIDLVFATASDVQEANILESEEEFNGSGKVHTKQPSNFHSAILPRLERYFGRPLVKRSRVQWASADDAFLVSCQVSKQFEKGKLDYWFGLKRSTRESLQKHPNSFCAFGLASPDRVVLMPFPELAKHLDGMFTSPEDDGKTLHWHVRFCNTARGVALLVDRDRKEFDVSKYLMQ